MSVVCLQLCLHWVLGSHIDRVGNIPLSKLPLAGMGWLCVLRLHSVHFIYVRFHASLPFPDVETPRYSFILRAYTQRALSSTLSHRWPSISLPLFSAPWLSSLCIGWMANVVKDEIFLRGPKSILWLEAFFQCPAHSNGRRLRSGDKNSVRYGSRLWSAAPYPTNVLRRFRYNLCQRFRDFDDYLKFVRSRHRPSRPKIQYLLQ